MYKTSIIVLIHDEIIIFKYITNYIILYNYDYINIYIYIYIYIIL